MPGVIGPEGVLGEPHRHSLPATRGVALWAYEMHIDTLTTNSHADHLQSITMHVSYTDRQNCEERDGYEDEKRVRRSVLCVAFDWSDFSHGKNPHIVEAVQT